MLARAWGRVKSDAADRRIPTAINGNVKILKGTGNPLHNRCEGAVPRRSTKTLHDQHAERTPLLQHEGIRVRPRLRAVSRREPSLPKEKNDSAAFG
jgi:hypothetical protein